MNRPEETLSAFVNRMDDELRQHRARGQPSGPMEISLHDLERLIETASQYEGLCK